MILHALSVNGGEVPAPVSASMTESGCLSSAACDEQKGVLTIVHLIGDLPDSMISSL